MIQIVQKWRVWGRKRVVAVTHMLHRKRLKRRLANLTPSIFTNNCIGGVIAHDLRLQFNAPTVNLLFDPCDDFITYLTHLSYYAQCEPEECRMPANSCPVGILRGRGEIPDIQLHFLHYKTFAEAKAKWIERTARIHFDNIYVLMEVPQLSDELLERFARLPYANKMIFAYEEHVKYPFVHTVRSLDKYVAGRIMDQNGLSGRRYLDEFDYVSFLNQGQ